VGAPIDALQSVGRYYLL